MKRTAERIEFLTDVLITAVEGGINYWAVVLEYQHSNPNPDKRGATVLEQEEDEIGGPIGAGLHVDLNSLASAIRKIIDKDSAIKINDDYRQRIREANAENDCGNLDADDCDVIFQVAALNDVVYG